MHISFFLKHSKNTVHCNNMRLSAIKLAGFKSFVDPTTIPFPSNLVSVLGPNGCGKSNTIDAVRWVMGESSAKHLRGESLADVIFNGAENRKPVGIASVELVFDNSDRTLQGEYGQYNEVSVKRVINRTGQSQYFLNNSRCRRRDITDLFSGTGLGPRSYAIIEQGMIARLIEAKPEELRLFLEEAAGISKYKERRKETETRMCHTQENLDRLADLRSELEKQIQHLQQQAETAQQYQQLKQQERSYQTQLQGLRWQDVAQQIQHCSSASQKHTQQLAALAEKIHAMDTEVELLQDTLHIQDTQLEQLQEQFYQLNTEIATLEQQIQHTEQQYQQNEQALQTIEKDLQDAKQLVVHDTAQLSQLEIEIEEVSPLLETLQQQAEVLQVQLQQQQEMMDNWQYQWDEINQAYQEPMQQVEREKQAIQHLQKHSIEQQQREQKIQTELQQLAIEETEKNITVLEARYREAASACDKVLLKREEILTDISQVKQQLRDVHQEREDKQKQLQHLKEQKASLQALQNAALGKDNKKLNQWLATHHLEHYPRLGEVISITEKWQKALECVLSDSLEAILIDDLDTIAIALSNEIAHSLCMMDTKNVNQTLHTPLSQRLVPLGKYIKKENIAACKDCNIENILQFLNTIYTLENIEEALSLRSQLGIGESLITVEGVWIHANSLRVVGKESNKQGMLAREKALHSLIEKVENADQLIQLLVEKQQQQEQQLHHQEQQKEDLQLQWQKAQHYAGEIQVQLSARKARLEQLQKQQQRLQQEQTQIYLQLETEAAHIEAGQMRLNQALEQLDYLAERKERLQLEKQEYRELLDDAQSAMQDNTTQLHQIEHKLEMLTTQKQSTQQALRRAEQQQQQLQIKQQEIKKVLETGASPLYVLQEKKEVLIAQRFELDEQRQAVKLQTQEISAQLEQQEKAYARLQTRKESERSKIEQLHVETKILRTKQSHIEEQITAQSNNTDTIDLEAVLTQLDNKLTEKKCLQLLAQLSQQITNLGAINLAAIAEYKTQKSRKDYLDQQNADLEEALTTLSNAIAKIDKETRECFDKTFQKVNKTFKTLFPRLFGGGKAYLELTGNDLLTTGVTVMARPPGKRNSTIHLLSGGEKAMTAVALIFAIFHLNPAPFCMLDEVDAPLDEANVGRFCQLVKDMSESVQFIYITHNKTTMEMSDYLCGVTMREPGVSRLVAVDLDAAVELASA